MHHRRGSQCCRGREMIWFIKDVLIYDPVHGCGHGSSYIARPCFVGTHSTLGCLQARGVGFEPWSNGHDIMQSDCIFFQKWSANWRIWKIMWLLQLFWAPLCSRTSSNSNIVLILLYGCLLWICMYICGNISIWILKHAFSLQEAVCMHPVSWVRLAKVEW